MLTIRIPRRNAGSTTGRRLAWARWLTAPGSRPAALLARVQVNRILAASLWHRNRRHAGESRRRPARRLRIQSCSNTWPPNSFAAAGAPRRCIAALSRRRPIARAARPATTSLAKDPDGRLLSRYPLRRLDAEAMRDSMLAASGDLDERLFGSLRADDPRRMRRSHRAGRPARLTRRSHLSLPAADAGGLDAGSV